MRRGSRGRIAVACTGLVALVAVAVGACSGSADAGPPPPSPVSPTAVTSSPTATATASRLTDQDAVAAAKAYFAAFNEGLKTRSSRTLRSLATRACIVCNTDAATIDSLAKRNQTVAGGQYVYTLATHDAVIHRFGDIFVTFDVTNRRATVRDADGRVVKRYETAKPAPASVRLHARGGRLLVSDING